MALAGVAGAAICEISVIVIFTWVNLQASCYALRDFIATFNLYSVYLWNQCNRDLISDKKSCKLQAASRMSSNRNR